MEVTLLAVTIETTTARIRIVTEVGISSKGATLLMLNDVSNIIFNKPVIHHLSSSLAFWTSPLASFFNSFR